MLSINVYVFDWMVCADVSHFNSPSKGMRHDENITTTTLKNDRVYFDLRWFQAFVL